MKRQQFQVGPTSDRAGQREGALDLRRNFEATSNSATWRLSPADVEELYITLHEYLKVSGRI